jgi:hypothetical protein
MAKIEFKWSEAPAQHVGQEGRELIDDSGRVVCKASRGRYSDANWRAVDVRKAAGEFIGEFKTEEQAKAACIIVASTPTNAVEMFLELVECGEKTYRALENKEPDPREKYGMRNAAAACNVIHTKMMRLLKAGEGT